MTWFNKKKTQKHNCRSWGVRETSDYTPSYAQAGFSYVLRVHFNTDKACFHKYPSIKPLAKEFFKILESEFPIQKYQKKEGEEEFEGFYLGETPQEGLAYVGHQKDQKEIIDYLLKPEIIEGNLRDTLYKFAENHYTEQSH
ncbi:MAG: hypothetical protein ACI83O_000607 [Patescibacteria group bacterium]|jgi:hypothetical protein